MHVRQAELAALQGARNKRRGTGQGFAAHGSAGLHAHTVNAQYKRHKIMVYAVNMCAVSLYKTQS